ncbi:MAG: hypothetical protein AABX11_03585 [Nanoarchaeota archaeon]
MEIAEATYKSATENWQGLFEKIFALPERYHSIKANNSTFGRSMVLQEKCFVNISVYSESQRIGVLYVGTNKSEGKRLLEKKLDASLEERSPIEKIFSEEEIQRLDKRITVSKPISTGPLEI